MRSTDAPTRFEELNAILSDLVAGASAALGTNLVGAYLQGSFAVGDADEYSDVDFLVVTNTPVTATQEADLRAMHRAFPDRDVYWAQHLEGSYPPADEVRTMAVAGKPWLYVDNGWREMQRHPHDNTAVTRWSLREHGVTLGGPPPDSLVDPVSPDALWRQAVDVARSFVPSLDGWTQLDNAWLQTYAVASFCRFLFTMTTGEVTSKRAAMVWAQGVLDRRWHSLIQQAIDDRPDPWERAQRPARPGSVEPTLAFIAHVEDLIARDAAERGLEVSA